MTQPRLLSNKEKQKLKEFIDEYLYIIPEQGLIYWKKGRQGVKHKLAGYYDNGYRSIRIQGVKYKYHRIIWFYVYGYLPENPIDHINGDKLDNRIDNLREVSVSCNIRNTKGYSHNTSGFIGVSFDKYKDKYKSYIHIKRKSVNLGLYNKAIDAAKAKAAFEVLSSLWDCNEQKLIIKQIKKCDKNFDYNDFVNSLWNNGFKFNIRNKYKLEEFGIDRKYIK